MAKLNPKHFKALELLEEGFLTYGEIADAVGINRDSFYDLVEGDTSSQGEIATLFRAEIDKITQRNTEKIKVLYKDNKKIGLEMMNDYLRTMKRRAQNRQIKAINRAEAKELTSIMNSLAKGAPKVEIGSFSIHKGITAEDMVNEFKRLSAIARNTLVTGGVRGTGSGASGTVSASLEPRNRLPQVEEAPLLHSSPSEDGELPHK